MELLQLLAELGERSFVLPDLYTAARIPRFYIAVILRTDLRAAAADDVLPDSYVAVIFPRFDAAARKKTDLMSELQFLQLLAELYTAAEYSTLL
jgi:hypothetical protein